VNNLPRSTLQSLLKDYTTNKTALDNGIIYGMICYLSNKLIINQIKHTDEGLEAQQAV
jgi:hypothetical protein